MSNTYEVTCVSTAMSPITHMSGSAGNESIIAREPINTPKGRIFLPFLSGNALRHRCIREPGATWLINFLELRGELSLAQLNFLYHGGNLTESSGHENTSRIAEMKECLPFIRLVGGCLPNQILAGSLDTYRGILACEENRQFLGFQCGAALPSKRLKPAEEYTGNWQYTRSDSGKRAEHVDHESEASSLMIFSGQSVNRGAVFIHGFLLKHVTQIELGSLLLSLRLWQSQGGTIGGQAARGHGKLALSIVQMDVDQDEAVHAYIEHMVKNRERAVKWLNDAFAKKEKPKAEKSKGSKVK